MLDSPHLARWVEQFSGEELVIRLFPSTPNRRVHEQICQLANRGDTVAMFSYPTTIACWLWLAYLPDLFFRGFIRRTLLQREMRRFQPDIVHGIELQHGAYLAFDALSKMRELEKGPRLYVTNYGSDIYWFQHFPRHKRKIRQVLQRADLYLSECARDVELAEKLGYRGRTALCGPNAGGFDFSAQPLRDISFDQLQRPLIVVKGYTSFVGRAQVPIRIMRGIELPAGVSVVVYSANLRARLLVLWERIHGVRIVAHPKKYFTHDEMIALFLRARIYIGHSLSDGISTSFLEALATGAYPIQTNTACIDEWAAKGFVFDSVEPLNDDQLTDCILKCLESPGPIQEATRLNRELAEDLLDHEKITQIVSNIYASS